MAESHVFVHDTDGGLYHREVRLASIPGADGRPSPEVLREAFSSTRQIEERLEELQIETEFWNRFG